MKKVFVTLLAMFGLTMSMSAATVDEIKPLEQSCVYAFGDYVDDGSGSRAGGSLFGDNCFFDVTGGSVATNKGSIEIGDVSTYIAINGADVEALAAKYATFGSRLNCLRLKNAQNVIAFKPLVGSKVYVFGSGNSKEGANARIPKFAKDARLEDALNDAPGEDHPTTSNYVYEFTVPEGFDGTVPMYMGTYNGDAFFSFIVVEVPAVDDSEELVAAVDSLNKLIAEAEAWKAELKAEDEMHAQVLGMLDQMIPAAKAVAEAPESLEVVNQMIFDVYVTLGTYKPMIEQYDAKLAANTAIEEAKALLATYSNYTDEAGFAAAIAATENALVDVNTGMATLEELNAAVEALAAAQEAFIAENAKAVTEEVAYLQVGIVDFEDETTFAEGWTLGGGVTQYWNTREDGTHFMNVKENMKGNRDNTYYLENAKFFAADQWKLDFDWAGYSSNSSNSSMIVYGDNGVDTIFYTTNASWSAETKVYTSEGVEIATLATEGQDRNTRGENCAVKTWYHFTLVGGADGVTLAITEADGTEVLAATKVSEFAHATGFNLHLGKALSQMALDQITMYIGGKKVMSELQVIDFEDEATFADGWTLGGGVTQYWNTREDGTHFMNVKENMKGNRDNKFELTNNKFLTADDWGLDFDWAGYSSNSSNSSMIVYGDNGVDTIFYTTNASWSAETKVYTSEGVEIATLATEGQDRNTRGENCAVKTWYHFTLVGGADGVTLAITAADGTEVLAATKVSEFAHATGFNLHLGKALSQMALDDITLSMGAVATWGDVAKIDFEDEATFADGWTLGGGVTQYWNTREDGTHFMNVKENMKGNRDNTYSIENAAFLSANEWSMQFDWAGYSSNSSNSSMIIYGDNGVDTIFYTTNASWSAETKVYTSEGVEIATLATEGQDRNTRGENCAVKTWYHFTLVGGADGVTLAITAADGTEVLAATKVSEFAHATGFNLHLGKALSQMALDDIILSVLSAGEIIDSPKFTVEGDVTTSNLITLKAAEETVITYSINGGDTLVYTEPFRIFETSEILAWAAKGDNVSEPGKRTVEAGVVAAPVATITAVQNGNRVVELSCVTENTRVYYSVDSLATLEDYKMYVAPMLVPDTTTVYAYATLRDVHVSSVVFKSNLMETEIAAGTKVALNAPTFAKAVVDSLTQIEYAAKNLSAYIINSDQSSVLCAPEAKLSYEFYPLNTETGRIADIPSKKGEYVAGDTLFALPLGKLVAKAMAGGYTTAEAYTWLKAPAQLTPVWEIDFDTLASVHASAGDLAPTMTDVVFNGKFRATSTSDFSNVAVNGEALAPGFVLQTGTSWLLRTAADSYGLYNYNSGDRAFGFAGLKKNQVVKISYQDATSAIFMDGVIEQDLANTNGNDVCYNVTADGNATIGMNRYYTIHKVGVYISSALTQTPDFAITKVDGETHYVGMTSGTLGADIYYAFGTEEYSESQVLANDTTGGVEPVYETKIDTTVVYGEATLYTEPVALNKTTWVRAYALYQDVESEAREQKIEAGYTVQIAQPIITYAGTNEAGMKLFTISVDNSEVISTPATPIYYTLPGGKETLYNGGNITVSGDVYGWMTAVAKLAGYEDSKAARRYIDARESYTEKYEVVDADLETMPAEAGDVEIDYSEEMNVEQLGATAYAGRIYFHRTVDAAVINVSLPSVFNNNCYVTDAAGKLLERGVDYVIYEINADENPIQDVNTGNMAATAAKGYVVNFLNAELIGEEVIFVSAAKGNIAKANFTYTQPEAGYKVITNRMFAAATLDVPAYVLNAEGTAFELVETGAVVAPFQSVILASADICASVKSLSAVSAGIESIATDGKEVKEIKYYTVGGVEVEKPAAGVYVQQIVFTDGTVKTVTVAGK